MSAVRLPALLARVGLREPLRRRTRALLAWGLRHRSRPYVPPDGPTLLVSPHPDDGALGCGGLLALRRLDGLAVQAVCLTDGAASHPGHPRLGPAELAACRRREEELASACLGLDRAALHFLGLPDGGLDRLAPAPRNEAVDTLERLLRALRPAEILLPCRRDGSSEHEAAFALVRAARARSGLGCRLLEYPVWAWWSPLRLAEPLARARRVWRVAFPGYEAVKRRAIEAHASQVAPSPPWTRPVLSAEFVAAFAGGEEFLFEREEPCAGS